MDFVNRVEDGPLFNILNYPYFYNGGGVAIGDVNGDSLPDLFFTANQGTNRLYLNRGGLRFEDATVQAGVGGSGTWSTGVAMADVDGDGWLDLYVNYVVAEESGLRGHNELFINQGDGTFVESAASYGLDLAGYGTQGTFFDYDHDGDLDLYQLNHSVYPAGTVGDTSQRSRRDARAGDRLLRNDGGHFTDVSEAAGIRGSRLGYGLQVLAADFDGDGWTDLYVCNDFHEDDYLYLYLGDGRFRDSLRSRIDHTSRFSMGSDVGDPNNDGLPDLLTLDMKPEREDIRKTAEPPERYDVFAFKQRFGYYYQYPHNALQINRGDGTFAELSHLAGVDATDWSWAALFCDLDNDGREDLYITNGIRRRPNDMDYLKFISDPAVARQLSQAPSASDLAFIGEMPSIPLPNYLYHNEGGLAFRNVAAAWGLADSGFSNGAAYADLDLDGDLDLVVNHLDAPAGIYENRAPAGAALRLALHGPAANTRGIGAQVWVYTGAETHYREMQPVRGFLSSVEPVLHIGLGGAQQADSLRIRWPGGAEQRLYALQPGLRHLYAQEAATSPRMQTQPRLALWLAQPEALAPAFVHREDAYTGFNRETLLPHSLSMEGPRLATADVNADGRTDFFVCGAAGQADALYLQTATGTFVAAQPELWEAAAAQEAVAALWFDADGDAAPDLYVVAGGHAHDEGSPLLQDRLYLNDGRGRFRPAPLPELRVNGACVAAADYDGDGDQDLFVGGRSVAGRYGLAGRSFLLENDGKGRFTDRTDDRAPGLARVGMVSDAAWADCDGDGAPDLLLTGTWMPPQVWRRVQGRLQPAPTGLDGLHGWWNRLHVFDADADGDPDFVAGNLGLNAPLRADTAGPCTLYVADFDNNGSTDPILCYYRQGRNYPWASRDELLGQLVYLRKRMPRYSDYARMAIGDLFTADELARARQLFAQTFASVYAENRGDGTFVVRPLPPEAQIAPLYGLTSGDVDGDGHTDLVLGGNFYGVEPAQGRYDASRGLVLRGDRRGGFTPLQGAIGLRGEVRDLRLIDGPDGPLLLCARNGGALTVYRLRP
ncbi:MAG: VCBS repeat-containing protein [Bacteroidia bacterium]